MKITPEESIFYQALATTSLLRELSDNNFLKSDYYNDKCFKSNNDSGFKKILEESGGIGNPATMQMFLYILLVMPKEMLENNDSFLNEMKSEINRDFQKYICFVNTTYHGESEDNIDFYKHTRNAVSHSKCFYEVDDKGICYVTFKDTNFKDKNQHCEFKIKTADVGTILTNLQIHMIRFLNKRFNR